MKMHFNQRLRFQAIQQVLKVIKSFPDGVGVDALPSIASVQYGISPVKCSEYLVDLKKTGFVVVVDGKLFVKKESVV